MKIRKVVLRGEEDEEEDLVDKGSGWESVWKSKLVSSFTEGTSFFISCPIVLGTNRSPGGQKTDVEKLIPITFYLPSRKNRELLQASLKCSKAIFHWPFPTP